MNTIKLKRDRNEPSYEVTWCASVIGYLVREKHQGCGNSRYVGYTPPGYTWDFEPEDTCPLTHSATRAVRADTFKDVKKKLSRALQVHTQETKDMTTSPAEG